MIRFTTQTNYFDGSRFVEGFCLSTDTKPTDNLATGSALVEVDTGDCYLYDEISKDWTKV
jgi:hypothetical protein